MSEQDKDFPLLEMIDSPSDLRQLSDQQICRVADELRYFLLKTQSEIGGHLAAGLGAVELTVALHAVFDTPHDRLVWDVGHQAYPHKVLTGRRDKLSTIRKKDGLSGFPKRSESEFDTFGVGHSSTSIGAALGMALASEHQNIDRNCVAVIGDGGMTAGMAFEALNHAGHVHANMLVILNDNDMSISDNVGALSNYFARVLSGKFYSNIREGGKKVLEKMPKVWELARRTEGMVKGMVVPGTLFEELGFNYIGPVDGHDMNTLLKTLRNIKTLKGPQFLHVVTKKGKGLVVAEADPIAYHAVPAFDLKTGEIAKKPASGPTFSKIFGDWLCDMAAQDKKMIAITPAMREGSGMVKFAEQFPEQYLDVGIAEQHSVTVAAGLACEDIKPVVAIYSSFLQRAYDQLVHDVAIQNLDVLFAIDRAGSVGADGATHAGSFDITYLRCIPNMVVMTPSNENECRQMLYTGYCHRGPAAVRYPRGTGPGTPIEETMSLIPIGKGEIIQKGHGVAILAFGTVLDAAIEAAQQLDATVVNMRFVKPLDEKMVQLLSIEHDLIVTVEDNVISGGAGSAVNEFLNKIKSNTLAMNLGLPDRFLEHATQAEQHREAGIDAAGIIDAIQEHCNFVFEIDEPMEEQSDSIV